VFLAVAACRIPIAPLPSTSPAPPATPPAVVSAALLCDVEAEQWVLEVETDAWTGGAELLLSVDGAYIEAHDADTYEAAADGSYELLDATISIVADWRKASNGATAFPCAAAPNALLVVYDLDGGVSDCWTDGAEPDWWATIEGAPACP
jgi:hypothetical protein